MTTSSVLMIEVWRIFEGTEDLRKSGFFDLPHEISTRYDLQNSYRCPRWGYLTVTFSTPNLQGELEQTAPNVIYTATLRVVLVRSIFLLKMQSAMICCDRA